MNNTDGDYHTEESFITSQVMAMIGFFSMGGSLFLIFSTLKLYYRKREFNFANCLVLFLGFADLLQSIATVTSFAWWTEEPYANDIGCIFQGFMLQFGDVASAFAAAVICTFIVMSDHQSNDRVDKIKPIKLILIGIFIFLLPLALAIVGYYISPYAPVSYKSWCWIPKVYSIKRITMHYLLILLVFLYLFCSVIIYLCRLKKMKGQISKIVMKVICFPIVFLVTFFPLGVTRTIQAFDVATPQWLLTLSIFFFSLNGLINALCYWNYRKIYRAWVSGKQSVKHDLEDEKIELEEWSASL